ncbi:MAG: alcohol dehydrogenase catalytic domain-containing protein [Propionibacteriaceae bacterium]|jgi:threonine dehydrogenase-like Zn-dependent dehydrogenase|nr:alcohol dehydrogenase catalytic domain-containing protein [Propionibacteriaceae bacterium]
MTFPATIKAVQFVGKDQIVINDAKPLPELQPHEILLQPEACGICFSDTKLLHAFEDHPRKSEVVSVSVCPESASHKSFDPTVDEAELLAEVAAIPSYKPNMSATVPGHEPVARIVAVGSAVERHEVGERVLVQTDYRHLPTARSNAAFGYNFEGALQEYVIVDERVVIDPMSGERFLIPVSDEPTASQVALIEPWACVEAAYAWGERQVIETDGRTLVVADPGHLVAGLLEILGDSQPDVVQLLGEPGELAGYEGLVQLGAKHEVEGDFSDIIYFGADPDQIEWLGSILAPKGILNVVTGGVEISRDVSVDVGRVHYDLIRFIGTNGHLASEAYKRIPELCELKEGDKVAIVGAAGPMGLMHTMRTAVSGVAGVSMDAVDVDDARLAHLAEAVGPFAAKNGVPATFRNSKTEPLEPGYDYVSLMVPAPVLLSQAIGLAGDNAVVNAFAGFAVGTQAEVDYNAIAARGVYLCGTSGSRIQDMKTMLAKVEAGVLDTNVSLWAVTGFAGFQDAINAVIDRTSGGKIMVYPSVPELGLTPLDKLAETLPEVAAKLDNGRWTKAAEQALLGR